ncbi:hypothetical protein LEM8419_01949 [Neolewinella maritima]|uniref:Uncharacterized protein n=1 Tax=Neolewinella maritima TaxID=1383882 RepID=A0ABM9B133_9BACT|nr:hypothetical protein [Neolewinella maritima]CAH1000916.1 hypothetical protein LEM8419_01949 [Neolewinella maritima]
MIYCPAIKQVLAFHIGVQSKADAERLQDKLLDRLRENCAFATDYLEAYYQTIPKEQHRASKALTYPIEGYFTGVSQSKSAGTAERVVFQKAH